MLPIGHVYADCPERYDRITRPYFNKVEINDSKLVKFHSYFEQKYEELKEYRIKVIYLISKEEAIETISFNKKRKTINYLILREKFRRFA